MNPEVFEHYACDEMRRGPAPPGSHTGAAGGAPCGDLVRVSLSLRGGRIASATVGSEGCAAARAAAAAVAELTEGGTVLDAARIDPSEIAAELGGLSPQGRHGAELASDALHRALTAAVASDEPLDADERPDRVLVAMSGGVDSAVAAVLERDAGHEVVAVTLKLWADERTDGERSCCSPQAVLGARGLAHSMGMPHLTMDLEARFRAEVVDDFLAGYAAGRTPNPCVRCNGRVRIDAMLDLAGRLGAAGLATGHYARIADDGAGPLLTAPVDSAKDQTYMLSALRPDLLAGLRFPLAELTKPEVRRIAASAGLPVASARESQDLCFLAGEGRRSFLARHGRLGDTDGELVDRRGRSLGRHRGHHHFTVGQRRGIGVAAPEPLYVLETDAAANRVVVGTREELAVRTVTVSDAVLHRPAERVDAVRLRYHARSLPCSVEGADARAGRRAELTIRLGEPAPRVAPGQTACLMSGEFVVGQATIESTA